MTKPRKWPHYAEDARVEAIAAFDLIRMESRAAQRLLDQGQFMSAMLRLGEIADKASDGSRTLQRAKDAPEAVP